MAKIVGQESPSKNTQILYRRSRKVSNAISTVVNIHSSRNRRARFALERKIRRDNKRLDLCGSPAWKHTFTLDIQAPWESSMETHIHTREYRPTHRRRLDPDLGGGDRSRIIILSLSLCNLDASPTHHSILF